MRVAKLTAYLILAFAGGNQLPQLTRLLPALIFENLGAIHSENFV
jgi:hypothetical protein